MFFYKNIHIKVLDLIEFEKRDKWIRKAKRATEISIGDRPRQNSYNGSLTTI